MRPPVRCLVWELDETLWEGVVHDETGTTLRPPALRTLTKLSERGVLHAVAARGDRARTMRTLYRHGVYEMFSAVEVGWGRKSASLVRIAGTLGLGLDALAFLDAEPVERAEVSRALPMVRCYAARNVDMLPLLPDFRHDLTSGRAPTPPLGFARVPAF
ncbi:HAD-IIIC family phosphatase [Nocardia sp. NPDC058705]|uniref:HAD-IIIC family phosphatase n=1 Tax=Nocardia sp. NPDC058705 TaxID=3346609 RepID=UPI00367AF1F7